MCCNTSGVHKAFKICFSFSLIIAKDETFKDAERQQVWNWKEDFFFQYTAKIDFETQCCVWENC